MYFIRQGRVQKIVIHLRMIHCKNVGIDWSSRPSGDLPLYAHRSANFIFEGSQNVQGHQANFYQPQLKWNFVNIQNIPVFKPKPNDRKHASKGWDSWDAIIWWGTLHFSNLKKAIKFWQLFPAVLFSESFLQFLFLQRNALLVFLEC